MSLDWKPLALHHCKRADLAEAMASMLAGEIKHVLEEGCVDDCLANALDAYTATYGQALGIDGTVTE